MDICTIIARNYLAAARVLARSFQEHNPGGTCWTLVIDDLEHEVDPAAEPFRLLHPEDLQIENWPRMAAGYSVLELSTAVKPWLLRRIFNEGVERITYLDPDIQVFDSLEEVDRLLREHPLVVNPHLTEPMPRDGHKPSETDILIAGSFNLGFAGFAAGPDTERLIDWWAERLATDCIVAPEAGYFVDQRWMDFAPGLVEDIHILRDPGYNLAYWNFAGRELRRRGDRYEVNGSPLRFFHFSGYDPARPHLLSKHQDRIQLSEHPVLLEVCNGYARALEREGHADWSQRPYALGGLPDGTPLDAVSRHVFRDAVKDGDIAADIDIFSPEGARAFLTYLNEPAEEGGASGVTRYLAALLDLRPDLRLAFPDLDGPDASRLVAWAQVFGSATGTVPTALLPLGGGNAEDAGHLIPGVNIAGYFKAVLGVGEHARQLAAALETQGIPVRATTLQPHASPEDESLGPPAGDSGKAAFNLICVNADVIAAVAAQLPEDFFGGTYSIGYWAWEVSKFPNEWLGAFSAVNEVWVGSRHVHEAVAEASTVPVVTIPQPVSLPERSAPVEPLKGLPEGFRFLFAFDYFSVFERKNPLALIEAFTRTFQPGAGAVLLIKSLNHEHDPENHERLRLAAASTVPVVTIPQPVSLPERSESPAPPAGLPEGFRFLFAFDYFS
ncbi:MAG: FkbM family methyltransferase, partial [Thermoleophilaceae bacterium]